MGPLIFITIVVAIVVVIGFLIYGMMVGLGTLGRDIRRLVWPELPAGEHLTAMVTPQHSSMAVAAQASQQHCWEAHNCQPGQRETCPAYKHPDLPCWLATMREGDGYGLKPECVTCALFSLPALVN